MSGGTADRCASNPFYVLGLPADCSRAEIEREGQKLLAMLELGLPDAAEYETPVGARRRTADGVRAALAELRDPDRRILHELWLREPIIDAEAPRMNEAEAGGDPLAPFPAFDALGWSRVRRRGSEPR